MKGENFGIGVETIEGIQKKIGRKEAMEPDGQLLVGGGEKPWGGGRRGLSQLNGRRKKAQGNDATGHPWGGQCSVDETAVFLGPGRHKEEKEEVGAASNQGDVVKIRESKDGQASFKLKRRGRPNL